MSAELAFYLFLTFYPPHKRSERLNTCTPTHRHMDTWKQEATSVCRVFIGASVTHGVGLGVVGSATAVVKLGVQGPPRN